MARLEEELRHLMVHHDVPIDPTGLFFSLRRPASRAPLVSAGHRATTPAWRGSRGQGFFYQPFGPNRSPPVPVNRTDLTDYRKKTD